MTTVTRIANNNTGIARQARGNITSLGTVVRMDGDG